MSRNVRKRTFLQGCQAKTQNLTSLAIRNAYSDDYD